MQKKITHYLRQNCPSKCWGNNIKNTANPLIQNRLLFKVYPPKKKSVYVEIPAPLIQSLTLHENSDTANAVVVE